ncbi:hypothetical protein [Paludibaculum fermentans]|uniref:STAS domain-containing protein n=1 Tax=Paludibaculum fermentans TaxID=1473598 RepID=A0A7S7SL16_PALFE|nr:hypothetical protein [Paludibaculum fermentans]QOY87625.1 hypothetical protein IRI77_33550 [Paludibaculum fermentans]
MEALTIYQHDERACFRFQLRGPLDERSIRQLECSWQTAQSILGKKDLVVDVTGVTEVDDAGRKLLNRMRESGAQIQDNETGARTGKAKRMPVARRLLCMIFPASCGTD